LQVLKGFERRKLVIAILYKYFELSKGDLFSSGLSRKQLTDLTVSVLKDETWRTNDFKQYNFVSSGTKIPRGSIHPLMRVMKSFKKILFSMGFEEMPTNKWVESSFWNFDSLYQPQQHPARDAHDTFFIKEPALANMEMVDGLYLQKVKEVHEIGGYGSIGYRYDWSLEESSKNILRTHTTAVSARMLYALGEQFKREGVFTPRKYFSIDRVFRNETLDATHLAEFHQVEGLIADYNMSLGHLIGVMRTFYGRIGITDLKFKPAYNPYTEPSLEIFGFHNKLNKWIEVGNSGVFRPEMILPMGLPENVSVIAWGLSLERPTMIRYGIENIRDLFGHRAKLGIA